MKCGIEKPLSEFYKDNRRKKSQGYQHRCKECSKAATKIWRNENREHLTRYQKQYDINNPQDNSRHRLYKYGITPEQYDTMLKEQFNLCGLCSLDLSLTGRVCIDHDYETGLVRSILCVKCNAGLGMFNDDPFLLVKAAQYITRHKEIKI